MAKPRLTIEDVCKAYAAGAIRGGIAQSLILLRFGPRTIDSVLRQAIDGGYIETSGDAYRGWLTELGLSLLEEDLRKRYCGAVKRSSVRGYVA